MPTKIFNQVFGAVAMNYDIINTVGQTFNCSLYANQPITNYQFLTMVSSKLGVELEIEPDTKLPNLFVTIRIKNTIKGKTR